MAYLSRNDNIVIFTMFSRFAPTMKFCATKLNIYNNPSHKTTFIKFYFSIFIFISSRSIMSSNGFHSFFSPQERVLPEPTAKRHHHDAAVVFPPLFETAKIVNESPEMNILDLDENGELLISCRTSVNVTKKPSHTVLDLFHSAAYGFTYHEQEFKVCQVLEDRSVVPNTFVFPNAVNVTDIHLYAVNSSLFTYKGQTYRKFTFFGKTKNPRIGGFIFNWLYEAPHRIDVSPILARETRVVCYIENAFSSVVNFNNVKEFLYSNNIIERSQPIHMYDKKLPLTTKGTSTKPKTRAAAVEVDANDYSKSHKAFFKHRQNPIFFGLYHSLKPIPVVLKANIKSHRDTFNNHKEFYENHTIITGVIPENVDHSEYEGLCRHLLDIRDAKGDLLFTIIDNWRNNIIFSGPAPNLHSMREYIEAYCVENELALDLEDPSEEALESHYMSSYATTSASKKQRTSRPAVIEFDNSSYASRTTVVPPVAPSKVQVQQLIDESIQKIEANRPSPPSEHPSDNHINNLIDNKVKPVKNLILSTTAQLTTNMKELKTKQTAMAQEQLRLNELVKQSNNKANQAVSSVASLKSDHNALKSSFDTFENQTINRIGRYEFKLDDHIEHTEAQLEKLQAEDARISQQQETFNDGLDGLMEKLRAEMPDADWGPPPTINSSICDAEMMSQGTFATQSQTFEDCKNSDD